MNKQAYLEEIYNESFSNELEKIGKNIPQNFIAEASKRAAGRGRIAFTKALKDVKSGKKQSIIDKITASISKKTRPKGFRAD